MQAEAGATAAARQSAYNAKRAWAKGRGLITNAQIASGENRPILADLRKGKMANANYRNMRATVEAAARSSYAYIKAELEAEVAKGGECARVTEADIEFISMALSQLLTEEEIETLAEPTGAAGGYAANASNGSQGGGARSKQKGGALGRAIINFFRGLCSRVGRYSENSNAAAAGNVDAVAAAVAATSHADITQTLILGLAGAGTARGLLTGHNGLATVALTAFNIVNSILPNPQFVIANSASYIASWGPVGVAAAPVVGKLAVIGACAIAVWETNKFVLSQGAALFRGASGGGVASYREFLKGLCFHLFSVFSRQVTGSIQRRTAYAANVRRTLAAAAGAGGGGGGGGGGPPPSADVRAINAAVDAALPAAGGGLQGAFRVATAQAPAPSAAPGGASAAAAGTGLLGFSPAPAAAAAGGGGGALPTVTEEQAEDAADAATEAGEVAERESQRGPAAGAAAAEGGAAAAAEENSQAAGFEGMNLPGSNNDNNGRRQALVRGAPGGGVSVSGFTFRSDAGGAAAPAPAPAAAAPSARGTKRTLTAAAAAPGGGGGGAAAAAAAPEKRARGKKGGKGGKSRKQHGGRRNKKKTRKNRK